MNNLKNKLKKNGGFTLIEMLIVVAIIAILIAVSIPLVGNALDRARHATDQANERAAKAEILVQYLAGADAVVYADSAAATVGTKGALSNTTVYYYDANNGRLSTKAPTAYAQCTKHNHTATMYLALMVSSDGTVTMQWTASEITGNKLTPNLCTGNALT